MPCSPILPLVGITIHFLKLYCITHLRNSHMSIQSWVKSLCDLHSVHKLCVFLFLFLILYNTIDRCSSSVTSLANFLSHLMSISKSVLRHINVFKIYSNATLLIGV